MLIKTKYQRKSLACMFIGRIPKLFERIYRIWTSEGKRQFYIGLNVNPKYTINIYLNEKELVYEFSTNEGYTMSQGELHYKKTNSETVSQLISTILKKIEYYEKNSDL